MHRYKTALCIIISVYLKISSSLSCGVDVNECELDESPCENGECVNSVGGFRCVCGAGYKPSDDCRSCIGNNI